MDDSTGTDGLGTAFAFFFATPFIIGVAYWIVCAVVAGVVAPRGRETTFVLITLFILGPIGVAAAAIVQHRGRA